MNSNESSRGDENCLKSFENNEIQIFEKYITKYFLFKQNKIEEYQKHIILIMFLITLVLKKRYLTNVQ